MYDYGDVEFAMCGVRVLAIILAVAVVAFLAKSRALFVAGAAGSFLGYIVPEAHIHINGTAEACFSGYLERTAGHVFWLGAIGAMTCCVTVAGLQHSGRLPKQFSLRTLLLTVTGFAMLAAAVHYLLH